MLSTITESQPAISIRTSPPLYQAHDIHAALVALSVGDLVPTSVYIADYEDGRIPRWTVAEREESGPLTILTLVDPETLHNWWGTAVYVAHDIFIAQEKILKAPYFIYCPGCVHARHMLCDIRQEARKIAERFDGVRQGSYEPRPGFGKRSSEAWLESEEEEE